MGTAVPRRPGTVTLVCNQHTCRRQTEEKSHLVGRKMEREKKTGLACESRY